ncbi:hypothetical protein SUDANB58_01763 [Streptomyces sp. enrichment culture]|uniref:SMP-30/gluconolactonase/LRE family protein n=1 Tax=Streptomyces sp. enrichment culture TaxID=1795815 RepID=UPI003F57D40B
MTKPTPSRLPRPSRRALLGGAALAAVTLATGAGGARAAGPAAWPDAFPLPDGWLPEGIAIGERPYAYLGSRADGAVYRADLRTGEGRVVHAGGAGLAALGLRVDRDGLLYVAGGGDGSARVIDSRTGEVVAAHQLTGTSGHFVNDVALLGDRAWFTDSFDAVLYGVPRGRGGSVRALPLSGDWTQTPDAINANGVVTAPDGRGLIVVRMVPGELYHVSLATGAARRITLVGAEDVVHGDGLVRVGRTLYVVQNRSNLVSVWDLDPRAATAVLRRTITDPRFDVPATAARFGGRLYLVNARFTSPQTPQTAFNAVAVPL